MPACHGCVDGGVAGGDEGGHDVAEPAPVGAASAAVAVFGAGLLEQHRRLGDHRRCAVGNLPAGVGGVGGFVDEQAVAGGHAVFVGGTARVGDVGVGVRCGRRRCRSARAGW